MSGGAFDERDPCAERGSFDLCGGEPAQGAPLAGRSGGAGCAARLGPGVRNFPDWWPERFHVFMRSCCAYLVERIGERNIRAIILSGSFALNEGSVLFRESGPLFLSDIDLVIVLDSRGAHARAFERRQELGEACEALFPGATFSGHFGIGLFLTGELRFLPSRPGVFDLKAHGVVLWGDGEVLSLVPTYRESQIGGAEALILLENRMMVLLGAYPGPGYAAQDISAAFRYEIARAYTDIATAALCVARSYRPGYDARVRMMEGGAGTERIPLLVHRSIVPLIARWTRFKLDPGAESGGTRNDRDAPLGLWTAAAGALLDTWKRSGVYLLGSRGHDGNLPNTAALLRRRGRGGCRFGNLRFWREWLSHVPLAERIRVVASMRGTLLRVDPLDAIRYDGVRLIEHRMRSGEDCIAPRLTIVATDPGERWGSAAVRAHRMWAEIVFGRKGE